MLNNSITAAEPSAFTSALNTVNLIPLMQLTTGSPEIVIGLLDGPVASRLSSLASERIRTLRGDVPLCSMPTSVACMHGTFVAAILSARRSTQAAAICPDCTLLVRPIFQGNETEARPMPESTAEELAAGIVESVKAGARVLNLSVAVARYSIRDETVLREALDLAMKSGTLVIAAAGNQGLVGGSVLTAHPWVIPVAAYSLAGYPLDISNLGFSIGKGGLGAPGERIVSLTPDDEPVERTGTSVATPFVTGAIALLWSQFPRASAAEVKSAVMRATVRSHSIAPPLLNAWAAYSQLQKLASGRYQLSGQ